MRRLPQAELLHPVAAASAVGLIALALVSTESIGRADAQTIELVDMEGRPVVLERPAERVASIPIPMASTLIALDGGTEKLVGMNPLAKSAILEGILGRIYPEAAAIPSGITAPNFVPNVEALLATAPDLVLQWGGRGDDIVAPITNAGLTTMLILYGTEDYTRHYMTMAATAIGRAERIGPLVEWREEVQGEIAAKADAIPDEARPKVLYLLRALSDLQVAGREQNYNDFYIRLVGGRNAAEDVVGFTSVNREQIAAWNPDIILLNGFEEELAPDFVYDDPILSLTTAGQEHRVYKLPLGGYRWDPPNQESPLTWMWLANLVQPEVFDFDLRAEMRDAYRVIYDYELSDADIDGILRMEMQADATGYDRFAAR